MSLNLCSPEIVLSCQGGDLVVVLNDPTPPVQVFVEIKAPNRPKPRVLIRPVTLGAFTLSAADLAPILTRYDPGAVLTFYGPLVSWGYDGTRALPFTLPPDPDVYSSLSLRISLFD